VTSANEANQRWYVKYMASFQRYEAQMRA